MWVEVAQDKKRQLDRAEGAWADSKNQTKGKEMSHSTFLSALGRGAAAMNLLGKHCVCGGGNLLGVSRGLVAEKTEMNQKSQFLLSWSASSSRGETFIKINTQRRSFQITASSEARSRDRTCLSRLPWAGCQESLSKNNEKGTA